ncbi:Holliday junction resolvase-like protein [Bradyrhizobium sp. RT3a]|uniref:Holliday junction resolvase-like protein n=1 Tax=unclassified Bradyrhizobium TaxID=2631580 RepID=UPI00339945AE
MIGAFWAPVRIARRIRLSDATLFALDQKPPQEALQAIGFIREEIRKRRAELAKKERMTIRAQRTAQAVNIGKIVEKILPSFPSFSYSTGDCRALFEPIDYLIFSGLSARAQIEALLFVDVKSGRARLNEAQRKIKERVESDAVKLVTIESGDV